MIRLKVAKDFIFQSKLELATYHICYNYAAGRKEKYDVFVQTCDDPACIGKELSLSDIRKLIEKYEIVFKSHTNDKRLFDFGTVNGIRKVMKEVIGL